MLNLLFIFEQDGRAGYFHSQQLAFVSIVIMRKRSQQNCILISMHTDLHSTVGQLGLWMLQGQFNFSNATDCYLNEQ